MRKIQINWLWSQILAFFDTSPLTQFSKFNNFLWVCWFLGKNLFNFVPMLENFKTLYCHNHLSFEHTYLMTLSCLNIHPSIKLTIKTSLFIHSTEPLCSQSIQIFLSIFDIKKHFSKIQFGKFKKKLCMANNKFSNDTSNREWPHCLKSK